ncbi:hypothetical protein Bbelb_221400 [Branchiostoma belcheri]|nr:hypothetical protein Bbelb_221400 [Branchiostoma belcheri]
MEKQQELLERAEAILYDLQEITEEEDALDGRVADNAETPTVEEEKENDEGLIMKKGCEDHQEGHEWGTSEHDNCYCQLEGPDLFRFCYHVDCLPGSEIVRDSKGLWDCPGGFSTADSSEKRANMSMLEDSLLQILEGEDYLDLEVADDEETPAFAEENDLDLRDIGTSGVYARHSHGWTKCKSVVCTPRLAVSGCVHRGRTHTCFFRTARTGHARRSYSHARVVNPQTAPDSSEKRANMSMLEDSLLQILEGEDYLDLEVADDEETPAFAEENDLDFRDIGTSGVYARHSHGWTKCKSVVCTPRLAVSGCVHRGRTHTCFFRTARTGHARRSYSHARVVNPQTAHCAEYFRKNWRNSNWNDAPCHMLRYFICERSPNVKKWRKDYRCGGRYTTAGGITAECNPDGHAPCCSSHNWCGSTAAHCDCASCVDYRNTEYFRKNWRKRNWNDAKCDRLRYFICERSPENVKKWRKDYRCGGSYTTAGGIRAECNPGGHAPCCSPHNWCGSTAAHCDCASCVDYRNTAERVKMSKSGPLSDQIDTSGHTSKYGGRDGVSALPSPASVEDVKTFLQTGKPPDFGDVTVKTRKSRVHTLQTFAKKSVYERQELKCCLSSGLGVPNPKCRKDRPVAPLPC